MSLSYIGQQLTIYIGIILFLAGIIGNTMNIFIFSSVRTYRTAPCTFYFLVAAIHQTLYVLIILISRIVTGMSGIDLTRISIAWCKTRYFFISILSPISYTCSCLATIDQFLATSQKAYLRRASKIEWTHRIVCVVIIVWCLQGIPWLFFYNISPINSTCVTTNAAFSIYISTYLLGFLCAIPTLILVVFGWLTYRNIRQTIVLAEQHADRQLTKMILIQVILVLISIIPYGINNLYGFVTSGVIKDANRVVVESFISTIVNLISYLYHVGNFYMFLMSSSRFRRTVKDRIFYWYRQNQIIPMQPTTM
ncbi:unnamed protein product [Adineta steineri]|uniref:G-protein coupled receptors family 1 profile domain-containing protein n=2 Tax=Adineta steineri TaxID=433720 RepID=A0A815NPS2_9BILA|nr:unnamed protein product [Adineta steineri]CAF3762128.1 unnamed protein product [Adineta steineri]